LPAWKKIWKPVWISEWFPTPDHHDDHHHHHEEHHDHGWAADRKDNDAAGSNNKFVFKRSEQNTAQPQSNIQSNTKSLVQSPVYFPTPSSNKQTSGVVNKT